MRFDRFGVEAERFLEMPDRRVDPSERQIDRRHGFVDPGVGAIDFQHLFVADGVLGQHLRREVRAQRFAVFRRARHDLNPQVAHLVGAVLAPAHAPRRAIGIAAVGRRIVVGVSHREHRSARQADRLGVAIRVLPGEVPVLDVDEPLGGSRPATSRSLRSVSLGSARAAARRARRRRPAARSGPRSRSPASPARCRCSGGRGAASSACASERRR